MTVLAGTLIEIASLLATILIVLSVALIGTISARNKQLEDQWDTLPEVEKKLHQRLREAGE